ncbi:hypothetical protein PVAND_014988 [Polypedilum vanderplanki]|uniref:WAC domain-containing protein n=1 Tax=Polypedilum vanderplanki TaxID=319348 RepID=A0A9J6BAS5_POLVA|nr:hypothetical protein PVAND_014988 [Polypedilum vanderplanki]
MLFLILLLHHQSSAQPSPYSFKNQFIGNYSNYITADEELRRNYFVQVDVPDDRQYYRGFIGTVQAKYNERLRKVVAAKFDPIKDENSRVIKIIKNTFSQCLKLKHALRHIQAHKDIVEHLQSLGGSPYLSKHIHFNRDKFNEATDYGIDDLWTNNVPNSFNEDELWTDEKFYVSRYFEIEPYHAFEVFFDLEIKRCENDNLCLKKPENSWGLIKDEEKDFDDFKKLLRTLDDAFRMRPQLRKILIDQVYWPAVRRMRKFLLHRDFILYIYRKKEETKIKIKDLQAVFAETFKIDWLQVINSQLFEESKLTENDEILIEGGIELLQQLVKNLMETEKKIISDTFDITFIYRYRFQIILRFHNEQNLNQQGFKHGRQRWSSCLGQYSFDTYMQPALLMMYEQYQPIWDRTLGDFNRDLADERTDIFESAEKLILEAVDEFKRRFLTEGALLMPIKVATDILFKLKNLKVLIGLPKSILPILKLEEFYKHLNLTGNENFMKSYWEIKIHHRKLRNESKNSWRKQIDQVVDVYPILLKYSIDNGNIFYFSPVLTVYPFYHPLRPKFFNMATLFQETLIRLFWDISEYIFTKYQIDAELTTENEEQISYGYYKNWLKDHKEMQIGANYLKNEQLFWIADAVKKFNKYHRTVPKSIHDRSRLIFDYMHVRYKNMKGFQDAFQCNITKDEINKYSEYLEKTRYLSS